MLFICTAATVLKLEEKEGGCLNWHPVYLKYDIPDITSAHKYYAGNKLLYIFRTFCEFEIEFMPSTTQNYIKFGLLQLGNLTDITSDC